MLPKSGQTFLLWIKIWCWYIIFKKAHFVITSEVLLMACESAVEYPFFEFMIELTEHRCGIYFVICKPTLIPTDKLMATIYSCVTLLRGKAAANQNLKSTLNLKPLSGIPFKNEFHEKFVWMVSNGMETLWRFVGNCIWACLSDSPIFSNIFHHSFEHTRARASHKKCERMFFQLKDYAYDELFKNHMIQKLTFAMEST